MPKLNGLDHDVYFGDTEKPLPNWRDVLPEETDDDDDEPTPEERQAITGMLGFDPAELDD